MVILDNGHGFNTAGKCSPVWADQSQLFEWEFNRDVVRRIYNKLEAAGISCTILVREARDISLKTRIERANAIYKAYPRSFLVSIHGNAGGGSGWEVYTSPGETESDKIATHIYQLAKIYLPDYRLRHDDSDGDPDKENDFAILTKTLCPAVLTENLFYDNEKECRFMMSDFGREAIAKLHLHGIKSYLNTRK